MVTIPLREIRSNGKIVPAAVYGTPTKNLLISVGSVVCLATVYLLQYPYTMYIRKQFIGHEFLISRNN